MRVFHYYHTSTGVFHAKVFKCDASTPYGEKDAQANSPGDHSPIEGKYDIWRSRVDVESRAVIPVDTKDAK